MMRFRRRRINAHWQIKFWYEARGFGFIERDDGTDVFLHVRDVVGGAVEPPEKGDVVEFEIGEGRDGRTAAVRAAIVERAGLERRARRWP